MTVPGSATPTPDLQGAVSGLVVVQNSYRSVTLRWDRLPGVERYAVSSNGSVVGQASGNEGLVIWETDSLLVGIAAETASGFGPVTTVRVERPGGGSVPAGPTPTRQSTPLAPRPDPLPPKPVPSPPPVVIPPATPEAPPVSTPTEEAPPPPSPDQPADPPEEPTQ